MHLEVTFRNLNPREEVRRRAQTLYDKLERFLDAASEGRLIVGIEHNAAIVELVVNSHGTTYTGTEEDADLRTALDRVFHVVEDQLRRNKEKRKNHKGGEQVSDGFVPDSEPDEEAAPQ